MKPLLCSEKSDLRTYIWFHSKDLKAVCAADWLLSVCRHVTYRLDCSHPAAPLDLAFVLDSICYARVLRGDALFSSVHNLVRPLHIRRCCASMSCVCLLLAAVIQYLGVLSEATSLCTPMAPDNTCGNHTCLAELSDTTLSCALQRYQIPIYGQPGVVTQHAGSVGGGYPIAQPVHQPQYA